MIINFDNLLVTFACITSKDYTFCTSCFFHYSQIFVCHVFIIVGGIDRTQCCASKGVGSNCLGACSGNITNLPANLIDCRTHLRTFASCYDIPLSTTVAPTPGEFFYFASRPNISKKTAGMFSVKMRQDFFSYPLDCS